MKTRLDRFVCAWSSLAVLAFAGHATALSAEAFQKKEPPTRRERASQSEEAQAEKDERRRAQAEEAPSRAPASEKGGATESKKSTDVASARIAEAFERLAAGLRSGDITPQVAFEQAHIVESGWRRMSGIQPKKPGAAAKPGSGKPAMTKAEAEATPRYINFAKAMEERVAKGTQTRQEANRKLMDLKMELMGLEPPVRAPIKRAGPPKIAGPPPLEKSFKERLEEKLTELRGKMAAGDLTQKEFDAELQAFQEELRLEVEARQKILEEATAQRVAARDAAKREKAARQEELRKQKIEAQKAKDAKAAKELGSGGGAPR